MVDESITVNALRHLKASKASGLDNISPCLMKDAAEVIAKPLTRITNASLSQGVVPQEWKCARVTPLFKKGVATDMDNYRPISVLPVASKVLERVVYHQLYSFLNEHKLLNPYQCGFRRICHYSTLRLHPARHGPRSTHGGSADRLTQSV